MKKNLRLIMILLFIISIILLFDQPKILIGIFLFVWANNINLKLEKYAN